MQYLVTSVLCHFVYCFLHDKSEANIIIILINGIEAIIYALKALGETKLIQRLEYLGTYCKAE